MLAATAAAHAGKLPGLPIPVPPGREATLNFGWENDFLARTGRFDDQRTLQLSVDSRLGERWYAVVDYSILTNEGPRIGLPDGPGSEARIDEWGFSIARRFESNRWRVLAGAGLRNMGDFAGARIQNGFHRMLAEPEIPIGLGARIIAVPYLDDRRTDVTAWVTGDLEDVRPLGESDWEAGLWVRSAVQVLSGGRFNGNAGAFALLRRKALEFQAGLVTEWREGAPDNLVESVTAESERGTFVKAAIGLGPLDLAMYERVDGANGYGRMALRAGPSSTPGAAAARNVNLNAGMRLPGTAVRLGGSYSPHAFAGVSPFGGRLALAADFVAGNSPVDNSVEVFLVERQWTGGLAWFGPAIEGWVTPLASLTAGWRTERLVGELQFMGQESDVVGGGVLAGEIGADLRMIEWQNGALLALRLSLTGHLPLGNETVRLGPRGYRVMIPGGGVVAAIVLGAGNQGVALLPSGSDLTLSMPPSTNDPDGDDARQR